MTWMKESGEMTRHGRDTQVQPHPVHTDSEVGARTDPGPPPEMDNADDTVEDAAEVAAEHRTPVGINEHLVDEAVEAFAKAASQGAAYAPKAGQNIADTTALDVEQRAAVAYRGKPRPLPSGHPTPPPQEAIIVHTTPVAAPDVSPPPLSPPPPAVVKESTLSDLLDSVESEWLDEPAPSSQRDVPTYVAPIRRRVPRAAKMGLAIAGIVSLCIAVLAAIRVVGHRSQAQAPTNAAEPVTTTAPREPPIAAKPLHSASNVAARGATTTSQPPPSSMSSARPPPAMEPTHRRSKLAPVATAPDLDLLK